MDNNTDIKDINDEQLANYQKQLEEGIFETIVSGRWKDLLDFQSKVYRYSWSNALMAMIQANIMGINVRGIFRGAKQWEKEYNRTVKEGENPLVMLAPKISKYSKKLKFDSKDLQKGDYVVVKGRLVSKIYEKDNYGVYSFQVEEMNGNAVSGYIKVKGSISNRIKLYCFYELEGNITLYKSGKYWERQIEVTSVSDIEYKSSYIHNTRPRGFMLVNVYDVNQTSGDTLPIEEFCKELEGDSEQAELVYNALENIVDIPVELLDIGEGGPKGYFTNDPSNLRICIKSSLGTIHRAKTLIHEATHYKMYLKKKKGLDLSIYSNDSENYRALYAAEEVVVESVAYIVAKHFGFDTSEYSFDYVTSWSKGDPNNIKKVGNLIQENAREIIDGINNYLSKLNKDFDIMVDDVARIA